MTSEDFISLKDFILEKNTYLNKGYHDAFRDKGKILSPKGKDFISVFPADTKGDFLYLRVDGEISANENSGGKTMGCGTGRIMFEDTTTVYLVAIVNDAEPFKLLNNLRNTCMLFSEMSVVPNQFLLVKEEVVRAEMTGAKSTEIDTALKNLKSQTIIRLRLSITKNYTAKDCITNPCKC